MLAMKLRNYLKIEEEKLVRYVVASRIQMVRRIDTLHFNLEHINPPLTRVIKTQKKSRVNYPK